jgi:hypothetical protein
MSANTQTTPVAPELDKLLRRLETILPIVRQQQRDANHARELAYFTAKGTPERLSGPWRYINGKELEEIGCERVRSAEASELHSIGLAIAAFGGFDAISEIGWMLADRGSPDAKLAWQRWDGMAGHYL